MDIDGAALLWITRTNSFSWTCRTLLCASSREKLSWFAVKWLPVQRVTNGVIVYRLLGSAVVLISSGYSSWGPCCHTFVYCLVGWFVSVFLSLLLCWFVVAFVRGITRNLLGGFPLNRAESLVTGYETVSPMLVWNWINPLLILAMLIFYTSFHINKSFCPILSNLYIFEWRETLKCLFLLEHFNNVAQISRISPHLDSHTLSAGVWFFCSTRATPRPLPAKERLDEAERSFGLTRE